MASSGTGIAAGGSSPAPPVLGGATGLPARVPVVRSVRHISAGVGHSAALSAKVCPLDPEFGLEGGFGLPPCKL